MVIHKVECQYHGSMVGWDVFLRMNVVRVRFGMMVSLVVAMFLLIISPVVMEIWWDKRTLYSAPRLSFPNVPLNHILKKVSTSSFAVSVFDGVIKVAVKVDLPER